MILIITSINLILNMAWTCSAINYLHENRIIYDDFKN